MYTEENIKKEENFMKLKLFIKENNIQFIDIWYWDASYELVSKSYLPDVFFKQVNTMVKTKNPWITEDNIKDFNDDDAILGPNIDDFFPNPFSLHSSVVLFSTVYKHLRAYMKFKNTEKEKLIEFPITPEEEKLIQFHITSDEENKLLKDQNIDINKDMRCEIIMALTKMKVKAQCHWKSEGNSHEVISFKINSQLELIQIIEKAKYAILMVSNLYNKKLDTSKGIFSEDNLFKKSLIYYKTIYLRKA